MAETHSLNSNEFCLLVRKLQARLKYEYEQATGNKGAYNWNIISRLFVYVEGKGLTNKHSLVYFLVRDEAVLKYLLEYLP